MSRGERRFRRENIIKSRAKKNYHWAKIKNQPWAEFYNSVKFGIHAQWIKHTGRVCSCFICKRPRYTRRERRNSKQIKIEE